MCRHKPLRPRSLTFCVQTWVHATITLWIMLSCSLKLQRLLAKLSLCKETIQAALGAQEARRQLETAVEKAEEAGFETPDWEVAQHSWRLGRALWELGPAHHAAAKQAWTRAVTIEGPCQVLNPHAQIFSYPFASMYRTATKQAWAQLPQRAPVRCTASILMPHPVSSPLSLRALYVCRAGLGACCCRGWPCSQCTVRFDVPRLSAAFPDLW